MSVRTFALILLAVVVLSPPLAMASNNCAAMGADCEGPCGTVVAVPAAAAASAAALEPVSTVDFLPRADGLLLPLGVLEPPPRPVAFPA